MAKAKDLKHGQGNVRLDGPDHANVVSMGQVSMAGEVDTVEMCGYRHATVTGNVSDVLWTFEPLKTMRTQEAGILFKDVCTGLRTRVSPIVFL